MDGAAYYRESRSSPSTKGLQGLTILIKAFHIFNQTSLWNLYDY